MGFWEKRDIGDKRQQQLPTETLLLNLERFETKWKSKTITVMKYLIKRQKKALANIKVHIKDCLSNIQVHVTTSGNERLHRHLNTLMV